MTAIVTWNSFQAVAGQDASLFLVDLAKNVTPPSFATASRSRISGCSGGTVWDMQLGCGVP
jgi:hypothetical protein